LTAWDFNFGLFEEFLDLGWEMINIDGLRNIPIASRVQSLLGIALHRISRQRDDGDLVSSRDLTQSMCALISVNFGQIDIHQN
jgi:hypothetical protein